MIRPHGIVVGYGLHRVFHDFYPAPWLCVLVRLRKEEIPVWYAAEELADVYEVEVVGREGPLQGHVVNLEVAIRRHPFGLDGGQVSACYCSTWVLVCHVNAPDACSRSDIEDVLRWT